MLEQPEHTVLYGENEPALFRVWMFSHFEGRLLTLIESLGFDPKREAAVKSVFRQEVWKLWHEEGLRPEGLEEAFKSLFPEGK
jgi:hypothetical protein